MLALSLLFWGVYNLSFKSPTPSDALKNTPPAVTLDKNSAASTDLIGKISAVSKEAVLAPTLSADGASLNYFSPQSGQVMQADFYGNIQKTLAEKNISGLVDAFWSVDKLKAIIKIAPTSDAPYFAFYDLSAQTIAPLKNNLDQVTWQTNANRILYKFYDAQSQERTLNISDPDGSHWTKIADIPYKNISVAQVPRTGLVSFWNSGDAYQKTSFQVTPIIGGGSKILDATSFGSDYLWSPSGDRILVSHTNAIGGGEMQLGVMNANGGEYKNLGVPTFASKCVWGKDGVTVFYALPGGIPDNAVLPNDYKTGKFKTADTFWKVNIKTGEKTRLVEIADIAGQYDASQLFLNQSESLLFFVNKLDNKLYKIAL